VGGELPCRGLGLRHYKGCQHRTRLPRSCTQILKREQEEKGKKEKVFFFKVTTIHAKKKLNK
jgi:hypothetical protein